MARAGAAGGPAGRVMMAAEPHSRAAPHYGGALPPMPWSEIRVRLQPRAGAQELAGEREGVLVVRVTAPPVDGRANAALCRLIAKRAGVGVRAVSVVRGERSREKLVRVEGVEPAALRAALGLSPADPSR